MRASASAGMRLRSGKSSILGRRASIMMTVSPSHLRKDWTSLMVSMSLSHHVWVATAHMTSRSLKTLMSSSTAMAILRFGMSENDIMEAMRKSLGLASLKDMTRVKRPQPESGRCRACRLGILGFRSAHMVPSLGKPPRIQCSG